MSTRSVPIPIILRPHRAVDSRPAGRASAHPPTVGEIVNRQGEQVGDRLLAEKVFAKIGSVSITASRTAE